MSNIQPFDDADFTWGDPGPPGTGVTSTEKASILSRISVLESLTPPTNLGDLSDVSSTAAATNQYLRWNGTQWAPYTIPAKNVGFTIPFPLDGGGANITSGVKYIAIEIPFASTITSWTLGASSSGNIAITVSKAAYASHPTYTAISGSDSSGKPSLTGANRRQNFTLAGWSTTAVAAGDLLQVAVDSTATVTLATFNLSLSRLI